MQNCRTDPCPTHQQLSEWRALEAHFHTNDTRQDAVRWAAARHQDGETHRVLPGTLLPKVILFMIAV